MTNFNELPDFLPGRVMPRTDPLRLAVAAYLARFTGLVARSHGVRPALLPVLVQRARAGSAGGATAASGAVHQVDAGGTPVQALDRFPALLGHGWVLPDLCHRRHARALAS